MVGTGEGLDDGSDVGWKVIVGEGLGGLDGTLVGSGDGKLEGTGEGTGIGGCVEGAVGAGTGRADVGGEEGDAVV